MEAGLLLQYVVIALAVVASALYVLKRQMPSQVRRWRIACAAPLLRDGRPAWARTIGRWLAPPALQGGAGGACGGCNSCDADEGSARRH